MKWQPGRYVMNVLISLDQLGNSLVGGDPDETISSRLGRIERKYKMHIPWTRPVAKITAAILNRIDPRHCQDAIEEEEGHGGIIDNRGKKECKL